MEGKFIRTLYLISTDALKLKIVDIAMSAQQNENSNLVLYRKRYSELKEENVCYRKSSFSG